MGSRTVIKKAVNLPVIYRTLADGVHSPRYSMTLEAIELHHAARRAPWAGGTVRSSSSLVSTTFVNGVSVVENTLAPIGRPSRV
jgi:hypothetical protein